MENRSAQNSATQNRPSQSSPSRSSPSRSSPSRSSPSRSSPAYCAQLETAPFKTPRTSGARLPATMLATTALVLALTACRTAPDDAQAADRQRPDPAAAVAAMMAGQYDSRDQAAADQRYFAISLAMVPIWPGRDDGHWLYVEQAMAQTPEKPYRQRVYRVSRGDDGEVLSAVYTIADPKPFVHGWRNGALAGLTEAMLQPRAGCTVHLRADGAGWRGATVGSDCLSDLAGARYATAEVSLDATTMRSWDRGFDAAGKQVWGATAGPYAFVKRGTVDTAASSP
jgi:CpeT protein